MRVGVISRLSLPRRGLCALLTSSKHCAVVLELPAIPEDVEVLQKAQLDVLLFQSAGGMEDIEAVYQLRDIAPEIKILLLLESADEEIEFQALRAGVCGCVSNASDVQTLIKAVRIIGQGEMWVSRHLASRLIRTLAQPESAGGPSSNGLTPQEWKVLELLASGSRNKDIANRLSVSENTVKTHLYAIYRKINVDCRLAATLYYFEHVRADGARANGNRPHKPAPSEPKVEVKADSLPDADEDPSIA